MGDVHPTPNGGGLVTSRVGGRRVMVLAQTRMSRFWGDMTGHGPREDYCR